MHRIKKSPCYYVLMLSSKHNIFEDTLYKKVELVCLYICHQMSVFPEIQDLPYEAENWHAFSHEQYIWKCNFLDIFKKIHTGKCGFIGKFHRY